MELNDILNDLSTFIKLQDGESFEGVFKEARKVPSFFNPENETVELVFDIEGKEKTTTGLRLGRELKNAGVKEGDMVKVTRVSTKGTKVEWQVKKLI